MTHTRLKLIRLALAGALSLAIVGCHRNDPAAEKPYTSDTPGKTPAALDAPDAEEAALSSAALMLTPREIEKLGVATQGLKAAFHAPEASGLGVVVSHDSVAQSLAELRTAVAVARQSKAVLARSQRLAGTPGALPLDTLEAAQRQSTVDSAALDLARQRLSSVYGQQSPWRGKDDSSVLTALASGEVKLVRVTFPSGVLMEPAPVSISFGGIAVSQAAPTWDATRVWRSPADSTMPGLSFFAIVNAPGLAEGERLLAWTPVGKPLDGVVVPATAMILSAGKYWCYLELKPGTFMRTEFDPGTPVDGGYFVATGMKAGDPVVVEAAGQLLARELHPATAAD